MNLAENPCNMTLLYMFISVDLVICSGMTIDVGRQWDARMKDMNEEC